MRFCNGCLEDNEWEPIVRGLAQTSISCPICGRKKVYLYDTELNTELAEDLEELLDIYTPGSALPQDYPVAGKRLLVDELINRWHIFSKGLSSTDVYNIIRAMCPEKYISKPDLFDTPVGLAEIMDPEYMKGNSMLRGFTWDQFVDSIRNKNRFHTSLINLSILEKYCSFIRKKYKSGSIFYRGRVSSESGFLPTEMGAPPADKASAGRANSVGIQCLYLASDVDTTLQEVRAGAFDYVTVGKFELLQDIVVVDLKAIDHISPFIDGLDPLGHAINKEYLNRLNHEIGRALRQSDSILDYLPTQYIADFIKSITRHDAPEYSGVEYNSTLNRSGQNLAVFYPDLFSCIDVEVYHISELQYIKEKI